MRTRDFATATDRHSHVTLYAIGMDNLLIKCVIPKTAGRRQGRGTLDNALQT